MYWIKIKAVRINSIYNVIVLALFSLLFACQSDSSKATQGATKGENANKTLNIVTTTAMIGDVVKNVVGDKAEVSFLMGPGVDPHLYKATQGDLNKLTNADVVFYNGIFLEGKMEDILEKMAKKKAVYAVTEQIPASNYMMVPYEGKSEDVPDPHIWHDVKLWSQTVKLIADKMGKNDAPNAAFYKKNADAYIEKLTQLHQKVKQQIASIPKTQRQLITSHDAFGYLGRAYDIEVNALQGISTVTEFGLKDVKNLVDLITDRKIKAVFIESSVPQKPINAVIEGCKSKGQEVKIGGELFSDAMGEDGSTEGTYIGMIEHNLKTIVNALK